MPATKSTTKKISKAKSVKKIASVKSSPVAKKPQVLGLYVGIHLAIAVSAIGVLMFLGVLDRVTFATLRSKADNSLPVTIGIEHDGPLTLGLLVARKESAGYLSLSNRSDAAIHISVPSEWSRTEVTNAKLTDVTSEAPIFGFTRWVLPAHAGMKMLLPKAPETLFIQSTSASSAAIELQTIDLTTLQTMNKVALLQKQVLIQLWETKE